MEHFSTKRVHRNCPEDELGKGYEYSLRSLPMIAPYCAGVLHQPDRCAFNDRATTTRPGESIYDPTCGSAGMLISSIAYLKDQKKEWRNVPSLVRKSMR
jgi:type I restriction enzyme M protein